MVLVATPFATVAAPVPATVPVPDCLAKVTEVALSVTTTLPFASLRVAVRTRVAPEVKSAAVPRPRAAGRGGRVVLEGVGGSGGALVAHDVEAGDVDGGRGGGALGPRERVRVVGTAGRR